MVIFYLLYFYFYRYKNTTNNLFYERIKEIFQFDKK